MFGILIASYCTLEYCKILLCDLFVPSPLISYEYYLENREESAVGHCFCMSLSKNVHLVNLKN